MSILIVEDDPASAKILDTTLVKRKFQTIVTRSGKDALDSLRDHRDVQLVITDLSMPEMDGLTLLRHLRKSAAWSNLPVIICTVFGDLQSVEEAAELGCTQYLLKPISKELLMRHVRQALGIRRKSPTAPVEAKARSLSLKASYRPPQAGDGGQPSKRRMSPASIFVKRQASFLPQALILPG